MNETTNSFISNSTIRVAVVGVLAILALFLLAETLTVGQNFGRSATPATNTITVSGDGKASVAPDIATVSFSVTETGASVSEAQTAATSKTNAALDAVKKLGVADKDVRTDYYQVTPQYEQTPCQGGYCPNYLPPANQRIVGYEVSESISVKVRDLDKTGDVLQALGTLGVQNISGPDFALDNPTAGADAARADAINNAKAQAQTLANQLGVHLGKVVSFNENGGGYPIMYGKTMSAGASADAGAPAPDLPTGTNEYSSSVSITYEIW